MAGDIKAISPCVKSASAKLVLDLHTVSAPSGEERTLGAAAQVERATRCCRRFDSGTQTCCGHATVMVLVSSGSGARVRGCLRAPGHFNPYPVADKAMWRSVSTKYAVSLQLRRAEHSQSQVITRRRAPLSQNVSMSRVLFLRIYGFWEGRRDRGAWRNADQRIRLPPD